MYVILKSRECCNKNTLKSTPYKNLYFRHLNVKRCCRVPKMEDVDSEVNIIFYFGSTSIYFTTLSVRPDILHPFMV